MSKHPNHQKVIDTLSANPQPLIEWAAVAIIALGAKSQWSMDDNYATTEGLAALAGVKYGLPAAGAQDDDDLRFYGEPALELGLEADLSDMTDDDTIGA
jgi:hypothetical protein